MAEMDRRGFLAGSALGVAGLAGIALQPVPDEPPVARGTLAKAIPETVGSYRVDGSQGVILPPDTPLNRQVYSDVLIRLYVDPTGALVMLLAAAGAASGAGLTVHRPERCYPAAGFEIERSVTAPLSAPAPADARARLVTAVRAGRRELVEYWVRVGRAFPADATSQRLALAADNLRGVVPAARLIRLSTLSRGPAHDGQGFARIAAFSQALLGGLSPAGRLLLLGS